MNTKRQGSGGAWPRPSKQRSLADLISTDRIDPAHARELKDLSQFIAYGTRIARRVLRLNSATCRKQHSSTQGALHFLEGLAQEFEAFATGVGKSPPCTVGKSCIRSKKDNGDEK